MEKKCRLFRIQIYSNKWMAFAFHSGRFIHLYLKCFNYPESVMHDRKGKIRYAIGIHKFINQQSIRTGAARVQYK